MCLKCVISLKWGENTVLRSEWSELSRGTVTLIRTKSEKKALSSFMLNKTADYSCYRFWEILGMVAIITFNRERWN